MRKDCGPILFLFFCLFVEERKLLLGAESTSQEKQRPKAGAAHVIGVVGQMVQLPCELTPLSPSDNISLVLWYRDLFGTPIYSYDLRDGVSGSQKHWMSKSVFGERAFFHVQETGALTGQGAKILRSYLEIKDVMSSDAGPYRCRVDFAQNPTRNAKIMLALIELPSKPSIYFGGNNGALKISSKTPLLNINETLDLRCESNGGSPVPHMSWWWRRPGSREMPLISESTSVHGSFVSSRLRFPPVQREDNGTIIGCAVSNTNLTKPITTYFAIDILLSPIEAKLSGGVEIYIAGQVYNISCQITGSNPPPKMKVSIALRQLEPLDYQYNANEGSSVVTVQFIPQVGDHQQNLSCLGINPNLISNPVEDTLPITVHYAPVVDLVVVHPNLDKSRDENDQDSILLGIKEGEEVELNCSANANPEATELIWRKNGKPLTTELTLKERNVYFFAKRRQLKIRNIARDNQANYSCEATNSLGVQKSKEIILQVQYPPHCVTNETATRYVAPGESDFLTCQVDANPSKGLLFKWILYRDLAKSNPIFLDSFRIDGLQSELSHVPFDDGESDYGLIECRAENSLGEQKDGACKFILFKKVFPEISECHQVKSFVDSVQISCLLQATMAPQMDLEFRVDIFSLGSTESFDFVQLLINGATNQTFDFQSSELKPHHRETDFRLSHLKPDHRYRLTILAIDRRSRAVSKPLKMIVKTSKKIPAKNDSKSEHTVVTSSTSTVSSILNVSEVVKSTTSTYLSTSTTLTNQETGTSDNVKNVKNIFKNSKSDLESNRDASSNQDTTTQTLPVLGIMLGTVAVIILAAVLIIVVKRNRRLPAVATTGSNPQTPTHVSFSTNVDNPPEIKLHRRKIIEVADTDSNDTEKLNDVHFDGFADIVESNRKFSTSAEQNITKPESEYVSPTSTYEVPVGSLCLIDEWESCQTKKATDNEAIETVVCPFTTSSESHFEDSMVLLIPTPITSPGSPAQQQQQQHQQQ